MPTLKLSVKQWQQIRKDMHNDYPKTVFMIKDKMKRLLGFTVREHHEWVEDTHASKEPGFDLFSVHSEGWYKGKRHELSIRLDFYSEHKYTIFLLKYSEFINKKD